MHPFKHLCPTLYDQIVIILFPSQLASHFESITCWSVLPPSGKWDFPVTLFGSSVVFSQAEQIYPSAAFVYFVLHTQAVQSRFWAPVCGCNLEPGLISAERLLIAGHHPPALTLTLLASLFVFRLLTLAGFAVLLLFLCCSFAVLALTQLAFPSISVLFISHGHGWVPKIVVFDL